MSCRKMAQDPPNAGGKEADKKQLLKNLEAGVPAFPKMVQPSAVELP
jgi:hypothetical protein